MECVSSLLEGAAQVVEVGLYGFPRVTVLVFFGLIAALAAGVRDPGSLRGRWLWLLLPAVIPIMIGAVGIVFEHDGDPETAPAWPLYVVYALLFAHAPVAIIQVAVLRRNPLVPLGVSGLAIWFSLWAAFMSSMSVQNDWL